MTRKQYLRRKRRIKRFLKYVKFVFAWSLVIAAAIFVIWSGWFLGKKLYKSLIKSGSAADDKVVSLDHFDTPTPSPTPVPIEGLERRDPKADHRLVLEIKSSYEHLPEVNARVNPWQESALVAKVKTDEKYDVSCIYYDPNHKNYIGVYGAEIGVGGKIVWIYSSYCSIHDVIEPWAVKTYDFEYAKRYNKSRVTIKQSDGNTDANVRSEPWESQNSSYGRINVGTSFVAGVVYVTTDKQWYGFPAEDVSIRNTDKDPDGIVWIYSSYCIIDPQ